MAFYDSWGNKLQKTGMDAIEKTKNTAENVRLKTAISDMEKDILSAYTEIGKLYYQKQKEKETDEEMLAYFQKIESRKKQIEEHQTRIRDLKGMTLCKNCGKEIEKNIRFCNFCGAEQFQKIEIDLPQQGLDKCPNCGSKVKNGQAFCTTCGLKLDTVVAPKTEKRTCVVCGFELDEDAVFCTNCGNRIEDNSAPTERLEEIPPIVEERMSEAKTACPDTQESLTAGNDVPEENETELPASEPGRFIDLEHAEPDDDTDFQAAFDQKSISDEVNAEIHEPQYVPEQILEPEQEPEQIPEPEQEHEPEQIQESEKDVVDEETIRLSEYVSEKLSAAEKEERITPRFCIYCGEQLESDAIFCTNCGYKQ